MDQPLQRISLLPFDLNRTKHCVETTAVVVKLKVPTVRYETVLFAFSGVCTYAPPPPNLFLFFLIFFLQLCLTVVGLHFAWDNSLQENFCCWVFYTHVNIHFWAVFNVGPHSVC